jgi:hypothetical protein
MDGSAILYLLQEFTTLVDVADLFVDPNPSHIVMKAIDFIINWLDGDRALFVDLVVAPIV